MSVPADPAGALIDLASHTAASGIDALLAPSGAVLVLSPHPDDETLGCGAAIVGALRLGRSVTIALLTDGDASHPNSKRYPPETLAAMRRDEFIAATGRLRDAAAGAGTLTAVPFALPDTQVGRRCDADETVIVRLADLCRVSGVTAIWSTWRGDPHCDHEAAAILADRVAAALGEPSIVRADYAVWGRFGAAGRRADPAAIRVFGTSSAAHAKHAAMKCYRSQLTALIDDDPAGFVMPPALVRHFAEHPEIFVCSPRETTG